MRVNRQERCCTIVVLCQQDQLLTGLSLLHFRRALSFSVFFSIFYLSLRFYFALYVCRKIRFRYVSPFSFLCFSPCCPTSTYLCSHSHTQKTHTQKNIHRKKAYVYIIINNDHFSPFWPHTRSALSRLPIGCMRSRLLTHSRFSTSPSAESQLYVVGST